MTTRLIRLRAYLTEGSRLPFVWGERDCIAWPAQWLAQERGADVIAPHRGAYSSRLSCARYLRRHGGLVAMVGREMASAGCVETAEPQCGDVGIISTSAGPMGAIRAGSSWAVKAVDGVAFMPSSFLIAWKV